MGKDGGDVFIVIAMILGGIVFLILAVCAWACCYHCCINCRKELESNLAQSKERRRAEHERRAAHNRSIEMQLGAASDPIRSYAGDHSMLTGARVPGVARVRACVCGWLTLIRCSRRWQQQSVTQRRVPLSVRTSRACVGGPVSV